MVTCLCWTQLGPKHRSSGGERLPLGQGGRAAGLVILAIDEVAFVVKMIVDGGVYGNEFLECLH